jgi:hypothetical protein
VSRNKVYRNGRLASTLYVASGSTIDYFYGEKKLNAFLIELSTSFVNKII